jgi:hypothetical protein|tara:strand:- start:1784 stop:2056 length:273 start_codon:yes stop_codon:yes gene_type:complete
MTTVSKAIKAINSDAKFTVNGDNDADTADIVWLEGTAEISKANIKTKMAELETEEANAKTKLETDKTNANKKLKDLGLTDDEIKAIKGIE